MEVDECSAIVNPAAEETAPARASTTLESNDIIEPEEIYKTNSVRKNNFMFGDGGRRDGKTKE